LPRRIAALAIASGVCGIAYELLYARLLTTYLGDMFFVGASILASFLLGIGLGARVAHRFVRWLWAVEVAIGGYAVAVALAFGEFGAAIQRAWLPVTSGDPLALVLRVFAVIIAPATAIGFSVPLFALVLRHHSQGSSGETSFRAVYRLYNLGAAVCVLAVEFLVLRAIGVRATLLALAGVNLGAGLLLRRVPTPAPELAPAAPDADPLRAWRPAFVALFAVSVLSGVYQMFLYKQAELIFGPFHENFALVLAFALVGIWSGTRWAGRRTPGFAAWLIQGSGAVAISLLAVVPLVWLWAAANGTLGAAPLLSTCIKIAVLGAISALPLAIFGGTVPALLRELPDTSDQAGRALAVSSFGNCAGYLLMVLWLYAALPDRAIATGLAAGLLLAGVALAWQSRRLRPRPLLASAAAVAGLAALWPATFLHYGYDGYASLKDLRAARAQVGLKLHRRYDSQIALLRDAAGGEAMILNGYTSVASGASGRTNLRELIYGLMPALYARHREHALVLGVGTGITAAATASAFAHTTAVELNPAVLDLLPHFAEHNLDLASNPRVTLVLEDGLVALLRGDERYDAIVNTVTSPLYFSSSKLYTREFFAAASARLAPGGVYSLWFDGRVTQAGARVIFETLSQSFADCAVTYLNTTYLQLICANESLAASDPASLAWDPRVRALIDAHGLDLRLEELLSALSLPRHRLFAESWQAPLNTFDRPVLEFLMASRAVSHQDWWSPYALLAVDVGAAPDGHSRLDARGLAARCYALRALQYADTKGCLTTLIATGGTGSLAEYARHVLAHERRAPLLPIAERIALAQEVLDGGHPDDAAALVANVFVPPREGGEFQTLDAGIRLAKGERLDDAALGRLFTAAPLDPRAREVLARALAARGDEREALAHAHFLAHLGRVSPAEQEWIAALEQRVAARDGAPR
jgi:predicted membrane-bound spermidine synthase